MQKYVSVINALKLLKEGYILETYKENVRYIFIYENKRIKISSLKYNLNISTDDFLEVYATTNFNLIEDQELSSIDLTKDNEYYSKLQKRQ